MANVAGMMQDKPLLGIFLMLGFCLVAPMGDAVAKLLSGRLPIAEVLLVRFALQATVLVPLMIWMRSTFRLEAPLMGWVFLRTLMHMLGIGLMFAALFYLPLADAVAIAFIMPFLMLLLGHYVLGEEVGWRRMAACAVGFVGTLLVVQPAFAEVGWPALLPLGVAVNFALFMLVTRQISRRIDAISLQGISGVMAVAIMLPAMLLFPEHAVPGIGWDSPSGDLWLLLLALGGFGTLAHLLMTWSLRYAPGATLAPLQYLELPFATVIGFVVFDELPNPLASIGICIIMAAGLYILIRERAIARSVTAKPPQADPVQTPAE